MFELIQAISIDVAAGRAAGRAHVPLAPWLADHFPGSPLVPGTLLLELAAQIAGPLAEESHYGASDQPHYGAMHHSEAAVLGLVRSAVFRTPVPAPADLEIAAELVRREPSSAVCRVSVSTRPRKNEGEMSAELTFAMVRVAEIAGAAWEERARRVERWRGAW
jgi:3-hydroxymyristoyl/3-hydroxydecanoyl-(acyl carrier protein) dehydratase